MGVEMLAVVALLLHRSATATTCNPLPKWSTLCIAERRAFSSPPIGLVVPPKIHSWSSTSAFFPPAIIIPLVQLFGFTRHRSTVRAWFIILPFEFSPRQRALSREPAFCIAPTIIVIRRRIRWPRSFDNSELIFRASTLWSYEFKSYIGVLRSPVRLRQVFVHAWSFRRVENSLKIRNWHKTLQNVGRKTQGSSRVNPQEISKWRFRIEKGWQFSWTIFTVHDAVLEDR